MPAAATGPDALRFEVSGTDTKHLHAIGALDGVAVTFAAARNGTGTGYLAAINDGDELQWKAPGSSTYGLQVDVSAGGSFILQDGEDSDKFVRVTVTASRLPSSPDEARVLLTDRFNNDIASDNVSAAEALAGDVETYTVDVANDSAFHVNRVLVWLDATVSGIEIGNDGVGWSSPTDEANAVELGGIAPGATATLHFQRTIGAAASSDPDVLNLIHYSFRGGP